MKKMPVSWLFCALLISGSVFAEDAPEVNSPETLIATVNGTPYRLDVFRVFLMERLQSIQGNADQAAQQQIFDEFMNLIVASQEGDRRKLSDERSVIAAMELARLKVMSNAGLSAMANDIETTEKELKEAYERIKKQAVRTEYKARHILLKDEEQAKKLIKQLDKGAKFEELAKKHSEGPTGKDGGDLGWFDPAQMVAPFAEAVTKLEPGSYTKEPVHTQFGWHIIELQETRKAEPPSFEAAKPQLTALVKRQKLGEKLTEMRNNAKVDLNESVVRMQSEADAAKEGGAEQKKD